MDQMKILELKTILSNEKFTVEINSKMKIVESQWTWRSMKMIV